MRSLFLLYGRGENNMDKNMDYVKKEKNISKMIRTEIFFMPLLVIFPIIVGLAFINEWYTHGFTTGDPSYDIQLIIGIIIIIGNIIFDIPFIRSLRKLSKK